MTRVLADAKDVPGLHALLERRRALGQDVYDEVWEGVYRIVPVPPARHGRAQARVLSFFADHPVRAGAVATGPVNIGAEDDYRIPDVAVISVDHVDALYVPSAMVVVEILSATEASGGKVAFYRARGVATYVEVDLAAAVVTARDLINDRAIEPFEGLRAALFET